MYNFIWTSNSLLNYKTYFSWHQFKTVIFLKVGVCVTKNYNSFFIPYFKTSSAGCISVLVQVVLVQSQPSSLPFTNPIIPNGNLCIHYSSFSSANCRRNHKIGDVIQEYALVCSYSCDMLDLLLYITKAVFLD